MNCLDLPAIKEVMSGDSKTLFIEQTRDSAVSINEQTPNYLATSPPRHGLATSPRPSQGHLSISMNDDDERLVKHQAAHRFFHENLADDSDLAQGKDFAKFLNFEWGFKRDDPRFEKLYALLMVDEHHYKEGLNLTEFIDIVVQSGQIILLQKAFSNELVVPGIMPTHLLSIFRVSKVQRSNQADI
jgi:hypothetical protein